VNVALVGRQSVYESETVSKTMQALIAEQEKEVADLTSGLTASNQRLLSFSGSGESVSTNGASCARHISSG
jgi:hypothetical protein